MLVVPLAGDLQGIIAQKIAGLHNKAGNLEVLESMVPSGSHPVWLRPSILDPEPRRPSSRPLPCQ